MSRLPKDFSQRADDLDPDFEPYESGNPVPWPLVAVVLALVTWGAVTIWYDAGAAPEGAADQVARNVAQSEAPGSESASLRNDPARAQAISARADGGALFGEYCATCHQANGSGVRAAIPPLDGSRYVQAAPEVPATILLRGISGPIEVGGHVYTGRMPTFGAALSDSQVAAILTYVRGAWSNAKAEAAPVTAEAVAALRADLPADGIAPLAGGAEIEERFGLPITEDRPAATPEDPATPAGDGDATNGPKP